MTPASSLDLQKRYGFKFPFKPDPLVRRALRYCKGKRVLDLGCGEGADSAFYAGKGFITTSIDRNAESLNRLRSFRKDHRLANLHVFERDVVQYGYPANTYDVVSCILVLCCMKKSQFETMLPRIKHAVKPGGIVIMSSRNFMDPELGDYRKSSEPIEQNTYRGKEDCCSFVYFIEQNRLRELFGDFEILYYFEGYAPCKYNEHPRHGDSYIICRRPSKG